MVFYTVNLCNQSSSQTVNYVTKYSYWQLFSIMLLKEDMMLVNICAFSLPLSNNFQTIQLLSCALKYIPLTKF